jgi:hypothetical protein
VYHPFSILSHPWTTQVELPIHHVEVWHVGLDVLQDCIAGPPVSTLGSTMKMPALGADPQYPPPDGSECG